MAPVSVARVFSAVFLTLVLSGRVSAQTAPLTTPLVTAPFGNSTTAPSATTNAGVTAASTQTAPDVYLNVPTLSVGRIELDVDNLAADINLNANVASLVSLNAGVQVGITKVNLTITDIDAQLELVVRLGKDYRRSRRIDVSADSLLPSGHLVDIVNRVFSSLDLNPLLINTLGNVTSVVNNVVGAVDGLLGSITQGGKTLDFVVDNLGNIVQSVGGVSSIVGDFTQNMTKTGVAQDLGNGLTKQVYSYSPLNALVDITVNSAGQVVQATVESKTGSSTAAASGTAVASSAVAASTAAALTSSAVAVAASDSTPAATSAVAASTSSTITPLTTAAAAVTSAAAAATSPAVASST